MGMTDDAKPGRGDSASRPYGDWINHTDLMDLTAWIVTLAGLAAMAWVIWYFWIYDDPVE